MSEQCKTDISFSDKLSLKEIRETLYRCRDLISNKIQNKMKTEYIFTVNSKTNLADPEKFKKFLSDEFSKNNTDAELSNEKKSFILIKEKSLDLLSRSCNSNNSFCDYYYDVKVINTDDNDFVIYSLTFTKGEVCNKDGICKVYEIEQKYFHKIIYDNLDKFKEVKIVWDGISEFNAKSTYPEIYEIENLMRKLITEFMMINFGRYKDWERKIISDKDKNKIKIYDKNSNSEEFASVFYKMNFIDLSNFLFKEESRGFRKISFCSNWDMFFKNIFIKNEKKIVEDCWEKLYRYRNKIAHNNFFTKEDVSNTQNLINTVKPILEKILENLFNDAKTVQLSSYDRIIFIKWCIASAVKDNLAKINELCNQICVHKKIETDATDLYKLYFKPAELQYEIFLEQLHNYRKSMEIIEEPWYEKLKDVDDHCRKFFSDEVNEDDENYIANLPDEMNDLTDRLNFYYLNEKFNS